MLFGAIDVGTNSIHLIVVELDPRFGTSRTILKAREMLRLGGDDALARGHLPRKAVQRGAAAIARFVQQARHAGASEVRVVATSAVREATNAEEFVSAVQAASDTSVEVLPEAEEARLIHLGVSRGYPLYDRVACIVDIGGGSTEFIVADAERPLFLHSVRLGSLRLYEEHLRDAEDVELAHRRLARYIRAVLVPVVARLTEFRFETLIGTSGTLLGLATLDAAAAGGGAQRAHGYVLRLDRVRVLQQQMLAMSPAERRRMPGMNPRRSDIMVAGTAILIGALELMRRDAIVVSERALREGVVVDYLEQNVSLARQLGDERMRRLDAAHELARRFGSEALHENHVAALALLLFDEFLELHRFEPADRDVLFAAALVHDVGRAINASAHHKHGAYIVRSAGLPGWNPEQAELIATLVRYHRKALPKPTHPEWSSADPQRRRRILGLGALLRLADALDVRRLGIVTHVDVARRVDGYVLRAHAQQDISTEVTAARFKADLFERAFGGAALEISAVRDVYPSFGGADDSAEEMDAASISG